MFFTTLEWAEILMAGFGNGSIDYIGYSKRIIGTGNYAVMADGKD